MTNVLSIDFDYFFEEDPKLDWSHGEVGLFFKTMWDIRRMGIKPGPNGEAVDLKTLVPCRTDPMRIIDWAMETEPMYVAVAESHAMILRLLEGHDDLFITNVDAHHDIHYGKIPARRDQVDCSSWGAWLIRQGKVKRWHQVYPEWRRKFPEGHDDKLRWAREKLGTRNFRLTYGEPLFNDSAPWDFLFLCRSGCWVPPDYDKKFTSVCKRLGLEPLAER